MSLTVGRHLPRRRPKGDYVCECDICGTVWPRSKLTRKADGHLYCPQDARGRDSVTLSDGNAMAASGARGPEPRQDGGTLRKSSDVMNPDIAAVVGGVTFGNGQGH